MNLPKPVVREGTHIHEGVESAAIVIYAPRVLSIQNNRAEFLGFIYTYFWYAYALTRNERELYKAYKIDLEDVTEMTLDAALVLTAEYHRRISLHAGYRPHIDDEYWPIEIRKLLAQLGFYQLVNAAARYDPTEDLTTAGKLRFVKFVSGKNVQQRVARGLIDDLERIAGQDPERFYIYSALVEAIKNVKHHAYPPTHDDRSRLPVVDRWWAAASFDASADLLQFIVYDQGVGIPETLPRQGILFSMIKLFCPPRGMTPT